METRIVKLTLQSIKLEKNCSIKKPKDLTVINEKDMAEILWWSCQLGISPEKIFAIIREVGSSPEKVKERIRVTEATR